MSMTKEQCQELARQWSSGENSESCHVFQASDDGSFAVLSDFVVRKFLRNGYLKPAEIIESYEKGERVPTRIDAG